LIPKNLKLIFGHLDAREFSIREQFRHILDWATQEKGRFVQIEALVQSNAHGVGNLFIVLWKRFPHSLSSYDLLCYEQRKDRTFKAGDGSLDHRVSEYLEAVQAHSRVERSAQFANDPSWSDRLGSKEDIAAAEAILKRSLKRTSAAITVQEMPEAIAKGYLSDALAQDFAKLRQQQDFEQAGQKSQSSGQKQS